MSYRVLALKWRPQRFEDVAGQAHVSRTLANALHSGRTAHAYLFTGPRGVGKTSMARILSKALNCERDLAERPCGACPACQEITDGRALDVIEIDGASNRGIDDIRDLREAVRYTPARLRTKVYIIDEVHMLTQDAFNALLKTLEEPPAHVVFILATTEVLKVPQTILSRCQRFDFARLRGAEAAARLEQICEAEEIAAERDALALIALKGEGSMRDALTLLDQVAASGVRPLTADVVREALGIAGRELFFAWTDAIRSGRAADALASFAGAVEHGSNLQELAEEFLLHLRNLMVVATDESLLEQIEGTDEERALYREQGRGFELADLLRYCRLQMDAVQQMRRSAFPRVHQEVVLAEMCALPRSLDLRKFVSVARSRFPDEGPHPKAPAAPPAPVVGRGESGHTASHATGPATDPAKGHATGPATSHATSHATGPAAKDGERAAVRRGSGPRASVSSAGSGLPSGVTSHESGLPAGGSSVESVPLAGDSATGVGSLAAESAVAEGDPWQAVIAGVRKRKPAIQGFLTGSSARVVDDKILRVDIPSAQPIHLDLLQSKENRRILVELVQECYRRPLGLHLEAVAAAAPQVEPVAPVRREEPAAAGIQKIVDLFDGDVLGPA